MEDMNKIYKEYFETVYKYLLYLTRNKDLAEELTQETFYKAIININKFNSKSKLSTWLCQIAKNLYFNVLQKNKKLSNIQYDELEFLICNDNLEDIIVSKIEKEKLYEKIDKLSDISRKVVYLRISGELSFYEIGQVLGKSENWARVIFYRAKNKLMKGGEYNE